MLRNCYWNHYYWLLSLRGCNNFLSRVTIFLWLNSGTKHLGGVKNKTLNTWLRSNNAQYFQLLLTVSYTLKHEILQHGLCGCIYQNYTKCKLPAGEFLTHGRRFNRYNCVFKTCLPDNMLHISCTRKGNFYSMEAWGVYQHKNFWSNSLTIKKITTKVWMFPGR